MNTCAGLIATVRNTELSLAERHRAFGELVHCYQGEGYRYAYTILGNSQLAQEIMQEAFLIAYQRLHQLRAPDRFPQWFRQIIRSQCSRVTRQRRIQTVSLDHADDLYTDVDDSISWIETIDLYAEIMATLHKLPPHEQTVIRLFYWDDYSIHEIAHTLSIPITTVKKRLQYARIRIREQLSLLVALLFAPLQPTPCYVYPRRPRLNP